MAIATTVVLGPRLFTADGPTAVPAELLVAAGAPGAIVVPVAPAVDPTGPSTTVVLTPSTGASEATPATEAPATTTSHPPRSTTTTTEKPAKVAKATTTTGPAPTTTTTAPPPPPPPPPAARQAPAALSATHADGVHEGDVSWYDLPGSRPGVCAHRTIDRGTVVTVTNLDTGASITCTVDDRGPYSGDDKVLDLHIDDFSRLAPLEQGVFPARLDW